MRGLSLVLLSVLTLDAVAFDVVEQFRADTNPTLIDRCDNPRNYKVARNAEGIVLSSKHIADANCIQVNSYNNEDFVLRFYYAGEHNNFTAIYYDADHAQNATKNGIQMEVSKFDSRIVYTDSETGQSTIYVKSNLTQLVFSVPFAYNFMDVVENGRKTLSMWLDTQPPTNTMVTFYMMDYAVLILELFNVMVLVDLGLVVVMTFRRYNLEHEIHSKIMWLVVIMELLSLFYFLWRYQFYFWHVPVFFYFFVFGVLINVFTIGNTSLGVFLHTAIFEKHICQNIPVIKRVHNLFGYISYALMKLSLCIKMIIFVYIANLWPDWLMVSIVVANPLIWLAYFVSKVTDNYARWDH